MKRTPVIVISVAAAALGLAGCSSPAHAGSMGQTPIANAGTGAPGTRQLRGFPGVSGLVADLTGSTAQVQTATSQTAVTWTGSTRFTEQRKTTASAVHVGACVIARPARTTGTQTAPGGSGASRAPGNAAPTISRTVAAATVEVLPSTAGRCTLGDGADRGPRPSGIPTQAPTAGAGRRGFGFGTIGTVASVGTGSFTVTPPAARTPASTSSAQGTPSTITVTWTSATTFTTLATSSASAVKVGVCVTALGRPDDTGAVTATSISVSQPVDGTCTSGFGGFGGFGRGGTNGATGSGTPAVANG